MKTVNKIVATLNRVSGVIEIPSIPLILCTDSYSLYEGVTKLGTTAEKRLMIDLMTLRQLYEAKEITEIRWIHGNDNPADAMTKSAHSIHQLHGPMTLYAFKSQCFQKLIFEIFTKVEFWVEIY